MCRTSPILQGHYEHPLTSTAPGADDLWTLQAQIWPSSVTQWMVEILIRHCFEGDGNNVSLLSALEKIWQDGGLPNAFSACILNWPHLRSTLRVCGQNEDSKTLHQLHSFVIGLCQATEDITNERLLELYESASPALCRCPVIAAYTVLQAFSWMPSRTVEAVVHHCGDSESEISPMLSVLSRYLKLKPTQKEIFVVAFALFRAKQSSMAIGS